jgi:hypothetical protein
MERSSGLFFYTREVRRSRLIRKPRRIKMPSFLLHCQIALFGRRPPERVVRLESPASENLHRTGPRRQCSNCRGRLLLDYFVGGGEQRGRHVDAQQFRGVDVDNKFELGRLLDGKIGEFFALENAGDVNACYSVGLGDAGRIAHQPAGGCELAKGTHRRDGIEPCQRH